MSPTGRRLARTASIVPCALALALALAPRAALALDDEREAVPRAAAPDQLGGQLVFRGGAELVAPLGSLSEDVAVDDVAATGVGASASVGLGISRTTELVVSGGYAVLSDPARCKRCGGDTARVGLGLAYHLAQGTALDPWARWGVGFRTTSIEGDGATSRVARELRPGRHHGLDVTQLALGATWSPVPGFGFGPYAEMDLGTYVVRPEGAGAGGFHAFFTFGLALQLTPGRSADATTAGVAPPAF
jgi:hypothetical protein